MSDFEIVVLGVGDTFSEKHHSTAILLLCDGFRLAIDCPDMYRSALRDASQRSGRALPFSEVDHVLIWDERLKASMSTLWDGNEFRSMHFESYFEHIPLSWTSSIQVGPFEIRARRTIHHVPTSALLVEAAGRTLGWSSDTAFDPELTEFLSAADLIIHETNFGPAHTPYAALAALPAELRARMRLIHYSDGFDTASSNIVPLREGEILRP